MTSCVVWFCVFPVLSLSRRMAFLVSSDRRFANQPGWHYAPDDQAEARTCLRERGSHSGHRMCPPLEVHACRIEQQRKELSVYFLSHGNGGHSGERRIVRGGNNAIAKHIDHRATTRFVAAILVRPGQQQRAVKRTLP